ncbi:MAG: TetR/AcrR family transcriptional regulator [Akkermansiaceae bacterium]|nr:TetR/AcrR family transcriptional regulator [Akkermansiaceae bacterium]MCP5544567.1 TetR/AcrR family transcriptional regulator [Akkermansiaceae bacterium]MCP5547965.1 TetR/AcrR family transcriptional regulator [Akkermansiaceae bacterium]
MDSASPKPDKKPKPSRSEVTRRKIIDAARAEFGDRGIGAATTRGIAERAGCNEVTLFRHFESKQGLLAAVVQGTSDEFRCVCECDGDLSGDLRKDLESFAIVYNRSMEQCEGMCRALIGESRQRPLLYKELIGDVLKPYHRSIARYLEKRKADGMVRADLNGMAFAEIFTSSLMGGLLRRSSGLSDLDRDEWIAATVDLFVRGLAE